jgi:site-specific DNA-methyltransferase (adenine-specific)
VIQTENATVYIGNNLDILPTLPDNSVDSIVTDPPYELGFMGKSWDSSGIAYNVDLWRECLRVLKPGGHLLSFGGTRTWHRIAVAIEDAGFEVRDSIAWMYGSGFPKSLDVSRAIDKAAGAEREVSGITKGAGIGGGNTFTDDNWKGIGREFYERFEVPASEEAQQWEGWGTALKPAFEPVIVARKPLIGTVAANVLEHGTGALNIDGSRIGTGGGTARDGRATEPNESGWANMKGHGIAELNKGRWPANVILDEYSAGLLDEQSGVSKSTATARINAPTKSVAHGAEKENTTFGHNDSGGASRFFYVAKASKRDRNEGLEGLPEVRTGAMSATQDGTMLTGSGNERTTSRQNFHPTVKPTALMRYLVKLVTPPGGTVLDPFTGSGSTGKAAILEGFTFIGCEMTEDYVPIIQGRLEHAEATAAAEKEKQDEALF